MMRLALVSLHSLLAAALLLAPVFAQRAQPPDAAALQAGRAEAADAVVEMLSQMLGDEKACWALFDRARARAMEGKLDVSYALLGLGLERASKAESPALLRMIVDAFAQRFVVDDYAMLDRELDRLVERKAANPLALTYAYLELAERGVQAADDNLSVARVRAALQRAEIQAERLTDPAMVAFVRDEGAEIQARRAAWHAESAPPTGNRLGRYRCFLAGDWVGGVPLLDPETAVERNILEGKGAANLDFETCISVAESWLSERRRYRSTVAAELRLVRRNIDRHALSWYRRAWLLAGDTDRGGVERARLVRNMSRLEDRILDRQKPGVLLLGAGALAQMRITGCAPSVEKGRLILTSDGEKDTRALCRYAFERIRSVTIRGGILSEDNLNFRFQVGPLNVLCNWEVQPENHFFLFNDRTHTKPRLLQPGKEHEFRIRQIGDEVVCFFDGEVAFRGKAKLSGTVCVYPAVKSSIFVREIRIDGDVDARAEVTEPSRKTW